jgi:hypothetical protein
MDLLDEAADDDFAGAGDDVEVLRLLDDDDDDEVAVGFCFESVFLEALLDADFELELGVLLLLLRGFESATGVSSLASNMYSSSPSGVDGALTTKLGVGKYALKPAELLMPLSADMLRVSEGRWLRVGGTSENGDGTP